MLLVTHDSDVASLADRSCTLRDGRLSEGTASDNGAQAPRELPTPPSGTEVSGTGALS